MYKTVASNYHSNSVTSKNLYCTKRTYWKEMPKASYYPNSLFSICVDCSILILHHQMFYSQTKQTHKALLTWSAPTTSTSVSSAETSALFSTLTAGWVLKWKGKGWAADLWNGVWRYKCWKTMCVALRHLADNTVGEGAFLDGRDTFLYRS